MEKVRARRFHRAAQVEPHPITARDIALLHHVHRHRFLRTDHLVALDGGNATNVKTRLRVLFDQKLLDRPESQRYAYRHAAPGSMVYAIGPLGVRFLRDLGRDINPDLDWDEKNKRAGLVFVEHTLGVADFLVSLELACRRSGEKVRLIGEHELIAAAPEKTRRAREPLRWQAAVTNGKAMPIMMSIIPDGLFGLLSTDAPANRNLNVFALEIDNGTIPIRRSGRGHRSIEYKLDVYFRGWQTGRHLQQFGVRAMQVAMVTTSATRVEHMLDAAQRVTNGAGTRFLLFTDRETLAAADGDPLRARWINGKGEIVSLIGS